MGYSQLHILTFVKMLNVLINFSLFTMAIYLDSSPGLVVMGGDS